MKKSTLVLIAITAIMLNGYSQNTAPISRVTLKTSNSAVAKGVFIPAAKIASVFPNAPKGTIFIISGPFCCWERCPPIGDKDPRMIFGINPKDLLKVVPTKAKTKNGKELQNIYLRQEAVPVTPICSLDSAKRLVTLVPEISNASNKNNHYNAKAALSIKEIAEAFVVGWNIGTFIDENTGISDALADWLFDTFGACKVPLLCD